MKIVASLATAALLAAAPARAESPKYGSFELGAGRYYPRIDAEADLGAPLPTEQVFGTSRRWNFRAGVSRAIFTYPGTLEVGFRTGFVRMAGNAVHQDATGIAGTQTSRDPTTFNIIPTSLMLTYRFDILAEQIGIPLSPYGRASLERYNWWVTDAAGSMSKKGATNGYSVTGGLAMLLDFFDAGLARELDRDTGINHTYLFVDVTKSWVKDFGSSKSWDLSDDKLSLAFGMMFVF